MKKLLSLILCLLTAFSMIPAAFADGEPADVDETDPAFTEIEEPEAAEEPAEEPEATEEPAEEPEEAAEEPAEEPEAVEEPAEEPEAVEEPAEEPEAEETTDGETVVIESTRLTDDDRTSNDDLFFRYVDGMFRTGDTHPENRNVDNWTVIKKAGSLKPGEQLYSVPGLNEKLNATEYYIEQEFKKQIKQIASGNRTSSVLTITFPDNTCYIYDISGEKIFKALLLDCPYELYWFDKTVGVDPDPVCYPSSYYVMELIWSFTVAKDYRESGNVYTVNSSKVTAAKKAVENANKIVTKYAAKNDYDKLLGYFNEIRKLSDYNHEAVDGGASYGDPWQMIYVFDGDSATKVVCEGYSKAFEYLCNRTRSEKKFSSDSINAFCVAGYAQGAGYIKSTGNGWSMNGDHMWNVVRMDDGRNYVVDATNGWFLLYADSGSVNGGYYLTVDNSVEYGTLFYPYYKGNGSTAVLGVVPAEYLQLSTSAYERSDSAPVINSQPSSDVDAFNGIGMTLSVGATGGNLTYRWQKFTPGDKWRDCENGSAATYRFTPTFADSGTAYRCIVSNAKGKAISATVTLTVYGVELSGVQYRGTTPYVIYNGSAQKPKVTLKNEYGSTISGSVKYRSNVNPGTAYADVTLNGSGKTVTVWFKIYLPATTGTTVANINAGIRITWKPVDGAKGYVIYRRAWSSTTNGWTTFERWNNTTDTTWTDTNVYAGTRYQYGVKAYYNDPMNNYDLGIVGPLKTTVRITTRKIESVTAGTGSMTVTWSGSKVFEGYELQLSTDSTFGNGFRTARITDASTYSKTIGNLSSGTTYYVRVRSYHVFDGTTYYGGWSATKSCTVH
ncbi:MAG: hypothetical protein II117_01625 [Clostridia bacterium]|nr:hypothetical protein [Clostridia bacterium]